MLHICRVYKPTRVVTYMSQEVLENQKKDDRYRYCLQKLAELQNRSFEWEIIERPELKNVQDFDFFIRISGESLSLFLRKWMNPIRCC